VVGWRSNGHLTACNPPTAFACYNDIVAMGATRALALRGIAVGRDIAVVGFDDIADAEHNAPAAYRP